MAGIKLNQGLQNLRVYPLAGLVGAHIFLAENSADTHDVPGESLRAVSFRGDEGRLAMVLSSESKSKEIRNRAEKSNIATQFNNVKFV